MPLGVEVALRSLDQKVGVQILSMTLTKSTYSGMKVSYSQYGNNVLCGAFKFLQTLCKRLFFKFLFHIFRSMASAAAEFCVALDFVRVLCS